MTDLLLLTASAEIEAAADGQPVRIEGLAYGGGLMRPPGFGPAVVSAAGLQMGERLTLLADHENHRRGVVGSATAIVRDGKVYISGTISAATAAGREIIQLARDGVQWQLSIGVTPNKIETIRPGQTITANGQTITAPAGGFRFVTSGVLREVSVVPLGADASTHARIAASQRSSDSMTTDTTTDTLQTEAENIAAIDRMLAHAPATMQASRVQELRSQTIDGVLTRDELRQELLTELRASRQTPAFEPIGGGNPQSTGATIEAALLMAGGIEASAVAKFYDEQTVDRATGREFRDHSIHSLLEQTLRAAGRRHSGGHGDSFIKAALEADREIRAASGGFSTLAISNILENVAHKTLLAAYNAQNVVWPRICGVRNLQNFKPHSLYRLDPSGSYKKVGPTGEIQHVSLTDAKYTVQADTFGAIIALNRQDMRNDDLDAFMQIPMLLGRMGAIRVEEAVFILLLSNAGTFFSSGNGNLLEAGSDLDIESLTDAKEAFWDQIDPNGKPILLQPELLLTGTPIALTAQNLVAAAQIIDGTATALQPNRNPHAGTLTPLVSPYLNNTSITDLDGNAISGQSDTQWYLFANPAVRAAIHIGFLDGQRAPRVESSETDFSTLGMQWRAYHDFGVAFADPVAAVKATGAGGGE